MTRDREDRHRDGDAPRDAHLLAALRHAPDRDAAPPPEVTARILAAARDAVRPAASPSWAQRLAAWLRTPQLGAAFGTIVVAVLVGMMWSTREPPQPAEPVAGADAAPGATASSQGATSGSSADAALAAQRSNDAQAPAEPQRDAAPAELAETPRKATAAPQAAPPAAPAAAAPRARDGVARRVDEASAAVAPAPPSMSPPVAEAPAFAREADAGGRTAAASPTSPAPAPAQEAAVGAAERQPMLERRAEAVGAASRPAPSAMGRLAAKTDGAGANSPSGIDAPPLNALASGTAPDLAWQVGDKSFAHGPAQRAWWTAVRAVTAGRWQPDATLREMPLPTWVGVSEGGRPVAALAIDGDAVLLTEGGRTWRAPVGAATLRAWQDELSGW